MQMGETKSLVELGRPHVDRLMDREEGLLDPAEERILVRTIDLQ